MNETSVMPDAPPVRIVLTTCASPGEASRLGRTLVEERLAACASYDNRPDCALRLAGAAAVMRENLGISLSAAEQEEFDQATSRAREKLPEAEQTKAWGEGRAMTADQVLEFVQRG